MKRLLHPMILLLLFPVIFILLIIVRSQWDCYRFYQLGRQREAINTIESIRYYGSSIKANPLFQSHDLQSRQRLVAIRKNTQNSRLIQMIDDELHFEKKGNISGICNGPSKK